MAGLFWLIFILAASFFCFFFLSVREAESCGGKANARGFWWEDDFDFHGNFGKVFLISCATVPKNARIKEVKGSSMAL